MKSIFINVAILLLCKLSFAAGGIWYLESDIITDNKEIKAYIFADYWADDLEQKYFEDDIQFTEYFFEKFKKHKAIIYFTELNENEMYVEETPFVMSPFEVNYNTRTEIEKSTIKLICLKKVWAKADVMNTILNDLTISDKIWLSKNGVKFYESSYEKGCELSAFSFGKSTIKKELLEELYNLIKGNFATLPKKDERYIQIINEMNDKEIVASLLCGC